jgi:hypothetical protein
VARGPWACPIVEPTDGGLEMSDLEVDHAQLAHARQALQAAGSDLDGLGSQMPGGGDYGAAGPLIALALGVQAEGSARLSAEANMLGFAIGLVSADMGYTDSAQAVDIITIGRSG